MKLVSYYRENKVRSGVVWKNHVLDLLAGFSWYEQEQHRRGGEEAAAEQYGHDILSFIEHGTRSVTVAHELLQLADKGSLPETCLRPLDACKLTAPIPRPPSMRDGYAFRQHVETARRNRGVEMIPEFDDFPVFYFTNHQAVVGPGPLAVRPVQLEKLDYELEVAIVVGKSGKDLSVEQADEYIFGMMIMNDWSARAEQMREMKLNLGPAKGKDFATGLGPYLVTMDELETYRTPSPTGSVFHLPMKAWVNDRLLSEGNVDQMHWTFAQILHRVSYGVRVFPGDVIGSGTVGTGCLLELNGSKITDNLWLQPGDRVVMEIEGLGRLENTIVGAE
jgi:fumarylacetoacetate (FAA) hydrolase